MHATTHSREVMLRLQLLQAELSPDAVVFYPGTCLYQMHGPKAELIALAYRGQAVTALLQPEAKAELELFLAEDHVNEQRRQAEARRAERS